LSLWTFDFRLPYMDKVLVEVSDPKRGDVITYFDDIPLRDTLEQLVVKETLGGAEHLINYTPENSPVRSFEEITVTEGNYFISGDQRDNSADSRYIGFIPRDQIKGGFFRGVRALDSF